MNGPGSKPNHGFRFNNRGYLPVLVLNLVGALFFQQFIDEFVTATPAILHIIHELGEAGILFVRGIERYLGKLYIGLSAQFLKQDSGQQFAWPVRHHLTARYSIVHRQNNDARPVFRVP